MTPANPAPLQVGLCLKAVKRMQKIVDAATSAPWKVFNDDDLICVGVPCKARPLTELCSPDGVHEHVLHMTQQGEECEGDAAFIVAARSVLGPLLAYVEEIIMSNYYEVHRDGVIPDNAPVRPVLFAIVAHLDQTSHGWRDEPESEVGG
jgi:hypothetical protein